MLSSENEMSSYRTGFPDGPMFHLRLQEHNSCSDSTLTVDIGTKPVRLTKSAQNRRLHEERAQKFHADDPLLPLSGLNYFWLNESKFQPIWSRLDLGRIWVVTASTVLMEFLRSFVRRHFAGKPVEASRNVGCFSEARAKHDWWLLVTAFICNQGNRLLSMSASLTLVLYLLYSGKPLITNRILQLPGGSNLNALCSGG